MHTALDNIIVVLHEPRDPVNIGATVRAMKNMGLHWLRLVDPVPYTPDDITRLAHRSNDMLADVHTYTDLGSALADAHYILGTSSHPRSDYVSSFDLRAQAEALLPLAQQGPVVLLFGPETTGLSRAALDYCHAVVHIPTASEYPSLNLAQSVILILYELRIAASAVPLPAVPLSSHDPPATVSTLEALLSTWENALHSIDFFKGRAPDTVLRPFRQLLQRARPSHREAALLLAIAREFQHTLRRNRRPPAE